MASNGHKKGLTLVNPSWRMSEIFLHRITLVIFLFRALLPSLPLINLCPTNFSTPLMMVAEDVKEKRRFYLHKNFPHTTRINGCHRHRSNEYVHLAYNFHRIKFHVRTKSAVIRSRWDFKTRKNSPFNFS